MLYEYKLLILISLLNFFYFIYSFIMPVKKTVTKKTTTKTVAKAATKTVAPAKVVETKKPTVIVETKKTDRCECGESCECGCKSSCQCGCCLKIFLLILIIANLVIVLLSYLRKTPRDWTILNLWWVENEETLVNDLYNDASYIRYQNDRIPPLSEYWIED